MRRGIVRKMTFFILVTALAVSSEVMAQGAPPPGGARAGGAGATTAPLPPVPLPAAAAAAGKDIHGGTPTLTGGGAPRKDLIDEILVDFEYDPHNKRDPFAPYSPPRTAPQGRASTMGPMFPLQKYDLEELKVVGVMWDVNSPKAMVKDTSGRSHIVQKNSKIGNRNGYVAQINEGGIVVVEVIEASGRTVYQTRVLKVTKAKSER